MKDSNKKNILPRMTVHQHLKAATGTLQRAVNDLANDPGEVDEEGLILQLHLLVSQLASLTEALDDDTHDGDVVSATARQLEDVIREWANARQKHSSEGTT